MQVFALVSSLVWGRLATPLDRRPIDPDRGDLPLPGSSALRGRRAPRLGPSPARLDRGQPLLLPGYFQHGNAHRRLRGAAGAGLLMLVLGAGCGGPPGSDRSGGADADPQNQPGFHTAEIRIENLQYQPPRMLGMVSRRHTAYDDTGDLPSGYKRVPDEAMQLALMRLEAADFDDVCLAVSEIGVGDPSTTLRRLLVTVDGEIRAFVVPRRPTKDVAASFRSLYRPLQDIYNLEENLRYDPEAQDPHLFDREAIRLDRRALEKGEGGGRAP